MRVSDFMHEMRTTSAILSRNSGINVVFEGDEAKTDGKTIYLPSLPINEMLTHEQVRAMRGYVDHEAGHIKHSSMKPIMDFYDRCQHNGKGDLQSIHNCLEDVWMEHRVVDEYPGARKNLKQVDDMMRSREVKHVKENPDAVKGVSPASVQCSILGNNPLTLGETGPQRELLNSLDPNVQEWGKKWTEEALKCKNSEELIDLSKSIYKLLEQDPELSSSPEDFDPESGKGDEVGPNSPDFDPDADPMEGKGKGKGNAKGEDSGDTPGDAEPSDVLMHPDEANDEQGPGGIGHMTGPNKSDNYRVFSTSEDVVYRRGVTPPARHSRYVQEIVDNTDATAYYEVKDKISGTINVMKNKLRRALLAKQQRDWDPGREVGRLDTKRLVSAYNGSRNVYKQRIDRTEADTAITVLIDLSGSMGGRKSTTARDSVVALSECLEGSNMPFKIVGFSNNERHSRSGEARGNYDRVERLDTVVFKGYNDSLRSSKGAVARINEAVGGNNSDYDFVCNELAELKKRPESRKVLFVLSDGRPAHAGAYDTRAEMKLINKTIKEARARDGIECVGIGICDRAVEGIYDDNVVIDKVEDLSTGVFTKLTKLLVG